MYLKLIVVNFSIWLFKIFQKFEHNIVAKIVSDIIDNSTSYETIIQAMTFVTSYCKNCHLIISEDTSNINTALQKAIY